MLVCISWSKMGLYCVSVLWKAKYSIRNIFICLSSPDAPVDRVDLFYDGTGYYIHRKRYVF